MEISKMSYCHDFKLCQQIFLKMFIVNEFIFKKMSLYVILYIPIIFVFNFKMYWILEIIKKMSSQFSCFKYK